MGYICDDFGELKLIIRCVLTATQESLTVEELWPKVIHAFGGGPNCVQLSTFNFLSFDELLKCIPDIVQFEDPLDPNSIINLVSSELSKHIEKLVETNIFKVPSDKKLQNSYKDLLIPYRVQCALIRIFIELYPKGLTIDDFISKVLFAPIFKSFSDSVEQLLFNLSHIFKKVGKDLITLQPNIVHCVKNIKEKHKFSAMDIYNIDDYLLENSNYDIKIAEGTEYPLFNILEKSIQKNIELLLDENPCGILDREICLLYIKKFGSSFSHYRRWGFSRVSQLFTNLPELCCVHFSKEDTMIVSIKNHVCDITDQRKVIENKRETKNIGTDNRSNINKKSFLGDDNTILALPDDCFMDQEFPCVEIKVNTSLDVIVCNVNMDNLPTLTCQVIDESFQLDTLLKNMKIFYFLHEPKFRFDLNTITLKQTYAFYLNGLWLRGNVVDYQYCEIKIRNIDDGLIHSIPSYDIRLLHKNFSQLPAQALTCFLDGILLIDENVLVQIIDKKCTIYVVSIDHYLKTALIKIKLFDSVSDNYLNNEWIKNGSAEPDISSDLD